MNKLNFGILISLFSISLSALAQPLGPKKKLSRKAKAPKPVVAVEEVYQSETGMQDGKPQTPVSNNSLDLQLMTKSKSVLANDTLSILRTTSTSLPAIDSVKHSLRQDQASVTGIVSSSDMISSGQPGSGNLGEGISSPSVIGIEGVGYFRSGVRTFGRVSTLADRAGDVMSLTGGVGAAFSDMFGLGVSIHQPNLHGDSNLTIGGSAILYLESTEVALFFGKDNYDISLAQTLSPELVMQMSHNKSRRPELDVTSSYSLGLKYKADQATTFGFSIQQFNKVGEGLFKDILKTSGTTLAMEAAYAITSQDVVSLAPTYGQMSYQVGEDKEGQMLWGTNMTYTHLFLNQ